MKCMGILLALLLCAAIGCSTVPQQETKKDVMSATKWEYLTVAVQVTDVTKELNKHGEHGWELAEIYQHHQDMPVAVFKRAKQ